MAGRIHDERSIRHGPFVFRYTGRFDWKKMYRETREFWIHRIPSEFDFVERMYKHKPSKIEVKWDVQHAYDAYYRIHYNVHFKCPFPKVVFEEQPDGTKKELIEGALAVWIKFGWDENYQRQSPAGESKVFQSRWLEAIYRKITWRERWDLVDDIAMFTSNDFLELLKDVTQTHARGYSIWEGG